MNLRRAYRLLVALSLASAFLLGCTDVKLEDTPKSKVYDYQSRAIPICNFDWNVIPLPNNLVNPVKQAQIGISIPGVQMPENPTTMGLPIMTEEGAAASRGKGYPGVQADSPLTVDLVTGMNRLNGFTPSFLVRIPFSSELDIETIKRYVEPADAATANFFFLDITDEEDPVPFAAPNGKLDYLSMNVEHRDELPYYLTLRNDSYGLGAPADMPRPFLPQDYEAGHSYLIVLTGYEKNGIKDVEGRALKPDPFFLLFAYEESYINKDGSPKPTLLSDIDAIRELEGARQITNYGLEIWKKLVGDKRQRNEVVCAFHFSIATNPMPIYMNPASILMSQSPILPTPSENVENPAPPATFKASRDLDIGSVSGESVMIFKMNGDVVEPVSSTVQLDGDKKTVSVTPGAYSPNTTYWVAANHKLKGEDGAAATDETYFGLARVENSLVFENGKPFDENGEWTSPHLDSRIDSLMTPLVSKPSTGLLEVSENQLKQAGEDIGKVLSKIDEYRLAHQPVIDALKNNGFISEREDLVLLWSFTTPAETTADGDEDEELAEAEGEVVETEADSEVGDTEADADPAEEPADGDAAESAENGDQDPEAEAAE